MNGAFLWIAGLIVALLGGLFAVPHAVDWNAYRGVFEEEASRMLGREVRVGGDVSLRLLPAPYVRFERPRIADETVGEAFLRADSFTMWLALPPLLQGVLEAKQIELKRPALRLQLDRQGGGNWQSLQIRESTLPFIPRDVSLQSVKISDGIVALHGADGQALTRIEIPDGELSAPTLAGPYKVRANVKLNDEVREVRVSTASPDPDGTRLKLLVRAPQSGNSYSFDGRMADFTDRPRFDGDLTANIPIGGAGYGQGAANSTSNGAYEVRARVSGNAVSAKLSDVSFSFEQNGQPQLLTGTAEASWQDRPVVKANLASRWLDLDRIADVPPEANALEAVRRLTASSTGFLQSQAEVSARITVDQANIAGDVVSGLVVGIENARQGLAIKELRAALPGGTRIDVTGSLTGTGSAEAFAGDVLIRGASLSRFLGWATRGAQHPEAKSDSGFALSARMSLGASGLELRDASVDAGQNRLKGDFSYRWEGRRQLAVSVETAHADLSALVPGALDLAQWNLKPGDGLADIDARIRVRANALTDGVHMLHNVDANISLDNGTLKIPGFSASTPTGFTVNLDGEVSDIAGRPNGTLHGVVAASTPAAMAEALNIGMADLDPGKRHWLASLAPLRLAFISRFGQQGKSTVDTTIDGMAQGEPLVATLLLEGGFADWRNHPADLMVRSDSAVVARIARGLLLGGGSIADEPDAPQRGHLLIKVAGTPATDSAVLVQLASEDLRLVARGRGALPDGALPRFAGDMDIKAADATRAFRFAGLRTPAQAADGALQGKIGVSLANGTLKLSFDKVEVGGSRFAGEIGLSGPEGDRTVDLDLKTDEVSLPGLVALALDGSRATSPLAGLAELDQWRDEPFDFSNLSDVNGRIRLATNTLALGEGFTLSDATLEAEIAPGRITVTKLDGRGLGGALSSAFKLEKTAAGAELSGALGLWDIGLDQITGVTGAPVGAGKLQLTLQLKGQAVTPRALIPVLTGKGELELKAAQWERLSPAAIETVTDSVLTGSTAPTEEQLRQALRTALAAAPLPLGNRQIAVEVHEGAVKIGTFTIETAQASVTNRTTIDLSEFKIDSEWKLDPKAARGSSAPLPGIAVIYTGPLKSLASLEPLLAMDALERELAVRGMERDVEQLERLRREDEARAAAEAERLKALELEQLQQMPSAGAQGPTIDVPFPLPLPPTTPLPQQLTIEPDRALPSAPPPATPKQWNDQWSVQRSGT